MGIYHRRAHILVPQELLDRPDIVTVFEQVRRKRVPKGVTRRRFAQARRLDRGFYGVLKVFLAHMMLSFFSRARIERTLSRWEHILPSPLSRRSWELSLQRARQMHRPKSFRQIDNVLFLHSFQMLAKRRHDGNRQHGSAILSSLPIPDHNLEVVKID